MMRKLLFGLVAAGATLVAAAPASAQFYSQRAYGYAQPGYGYAQPSYGYAQPGYGYGYQGGYGYAPRGYGYNSGAIVQRLDMRIAGIRSQIRALQARGLIRWNKARTLDRQAMNLQRSVRASGWNGRGGYDLRNLEIRAQRLEQQVRFASVRQRYAPRYQARYAGYRW